MVNAGHGDRGAGPVARIAYRQAMTLACLVARYTWEDLCGLPEQWMQFGARVREASGWRGPATFGVWSGWRDGAGEYGCALEMTPGEPIPAGWTPLPLPTAQYAIFAHDGSIQDLPSLVPWILNEWLPASGRARAPGFGGVDLLERYGPRFDRRVGRGDIQLWLPLDG